MSSARSARGEAEMGVVGGVDLEALDEAVLEIVRQIESVRARDRSVPFGELGVALGIDPRGVAVIDHPVRLEKPALVENLDVAFGGDDVFLLVVDHLPGFDDHARASILRRGGRGKERRSARDRCGGAGHDSREKAEAASAHQPSSE
ncbi:hypothetical protein WOB59_09350 [Methylocystis sp. IM4]|uniref:hypothetical protein n=1 Tax=Methylocystis sp. IM4 TaxID=3136560 RepID=UPI0031199BE8